MNGRWFAVGVLSLFFAVFVSGIAESSPDILPQALVVWVFAVVAVLYWENRNVLTGAIVGAVILLLALSSDIPLPWSEISIAAIVAALVWLVAMTPAGKQVLQRLGIGSKKDG
ncbi:MAG: hypothetical protein OYG31_02660 [Candidatus Kaiserbacteria bacterium]|nr:hypothetical protein [Candidatus Kaiserbacteria bacterium]